MENLADIITVGISVCAALATALPSPESKPSGYKALYRLIQFIGFNFGKARNAQDK